MRNASQKKKKLDSASSHAEARTTWREHNKSAGSVESIRNVRIATYEWHGRKDKRRKEIKVNGEQLWVVARKRDHIGNLLRNPESSCELLEMWKMTEMQVPWEVNVTGTSRERPLEAARSRKL